MSSVIWKRTPRGVRASPLKRGEAEDRLRSSTARSPAFPKKPGFSARGRGRVNHLAFPLPGLVAAPRQSVWAATATRSLPADCGRARDQLGHCSTVPGMFGRSSTARASSRLAASTAEALVPTPGRPRPRPPPAKRRPPTRWPQSAGDGSPGNPPRWVAGRSDAGLQSRRPVQRPATVGRSCVETAARASSGNSLGSSSSNHSSL